MIKKKKNENGLGRALMRSRGKQQDKRGEGWLHTSELDDGYDWGKGLQSVTEVGDLEDFLATAELTGREFVGEKLNVTLIGSTDNGDDRQRANQIEEAQNENRALLRVPRRPPWDETTTKEELLLAERTLFIDWKRMLAKCQENGPLLLTPFEKNIEVWRQLWRVMERSDVVVQIVDARNPLLFRCEDLVTYAQELDPTKRSLLLVNKADLLTPVQRQYWAEYFSANNIEFAFWSTIIEPEKPTSDEPEDTGSQSDSKDSISSEPNEEEEVSSEAIGQDRDDGEKENSDVIGCVLEDATEEVSEMAQILSSAALLERLRCLGEEARANRKGVKNPSHAVIGLVGYPNVGKSSTINSLCGEKKVSVSATPGKTKHFQTIQLDSSLTLCDCPGLVFPNFVSTKAELVVNGILPVDHLRDPVPAANLVAKRIPGTVLERTYGMTLHRARSEEGQVETLTGRELLQSYGLARGLMTAHGQPDIQKSGRVVLKDYIKAKLLYIHPPPGTNEDDFSPAPAVDSIPPQSVSRPQNDNKVRMSDFDKEFIENTTVRVLAKGVRGGEFSRTAHIPLQSTDQDAGPLDEMGRPIGKPWRHHNNKGKKEKMRRVVHN